MIAGFSITSLLLILLAGIGAGFVGYAVGASSLVSYPALLAFGIPPVLANASNTVGVVGTGIGGVMGARKELKGQAVRSITYVVIGAFGGVAGAFLLLKLDPSVFEFAAPVLILLSSLIIAINPRGRMQAKQAAADATAQLKHIEATEATEAAKRATTPTAPHRPPEQLVQPMSQDSWWVWLGVAAVAILPVTGLRSQSTLVRTMMTGRPAASSSLIIAMSVRVSLPALERTQYQTTEICSSAWRSAIFRRFSRSSWGAPPPIMRADAATTPTRSWDGV